MLALLKTILSLSLSGTLLILLLLLFCPLYRNRLSKRWQYYIWLLVIARLLLPITPETSLVGNLFRQAEQRIVESADDTSADTDIIAGANTKANAEVSSANTYNSGNANIKPNTEAKSTGTDSTTDNIDDQVSMTDTTAADITADSDSESDTGDRKTNRYNIPINTVQTLCIVWLVAALLLFVHKVTIYQSFVKYVSAGSKPVDDITLLERFGQIIAENRIKKTVDLCVNELVSSPLLLGFSHVRVVLPTTDLSDEDFYYTVLHELTHYKRRDMFYKWLVQLTICLHWFNPFVHLMGYEINRLCELSCDENVISGFTEVSRKSYGNTLMHAIGTGGSYQSTLASVTLNESKELLKGRLEAIMKYKKISKAAQTATVLITGILVGGAAVLGAYAAPDTQSSSDHIATDSAPDLSVSFTASNTENATAQDSKAVSQTPDYRIEYEDGTYYILTGGANEADKPISAVTNGYYHLVLVYKDAYHSFGSWTDSQMQHLVRHITSQCRTALENGRMTQEDMDIVIAAATEIQETYRSGADIQETYRPETEDSIIDNSVTLYNYTQSAYYQTPYIIEIGYNLTKEVQSKYSSTLITLSDQSTMPVFFSAESEHYISDETARSAVAALLERMIPQTAKSASRPLEAPFIVSMEYVGDADMDSLAEKYYKEEMLTYFGAIFLELDEKIQLEYLDRMFEAQNISFFACCIYMLEDTDIQRQAEIINHYIREAYEKDKVNFFAVLAGELDDEARNNWLERCKNDGRTNYYYILSDEEKDLFDNTDFMDNHDYFDEWNEFQNSYMHASSDPDILNLTRITKQNISTDLQNVLDSCDSGKWYVITENECQYIYYNGLPHTYAYEPHIDGSETGDLITLAITDINADSPLLHHEESVSDYVLLLLTGKSGKDYALTITYNSVPITYETISYATMSAAPLTLTH